MPLEWEWLDAAQTVMFFEGDGRWRLRGRGYLTDQNASRTVAPVLISIIAKLVHDAWIAGVIVVWISWCACIWALYQIVRHISWKFHSQLGTISSISTIVILGGTASGFLGFVGAIDAHVVGYAGAALGILMIIYPYVNVSAFQRVLVRPGLVGAALFILDGTLQLGAPLCAFALIVMTYWGLTTFSGSRNTLIFWIAREFSVFICIAIIWALIARTGSDGSFDRHNEALYRAREALSNPIALISVLPYKITSVLEIALALFRPWLTVAAGIGWLVASRFVKMWSLSWVLIIVLATVLTRYTPSTVFLVFPSVYVLAAVLAGWIVDGAVRLIPVSRHVGTVRLFVVGASVALVSFVPASTQLAFLWGDYTMPAVWWPGP
jgi:hypothetical protein